MNYKALHRLMIIVGLTTALAVSFATLQVVSAQRAAQTRSAKVPSPSKPEIAPREPLVTRLGSGLGDPDGVKSDPLDLASAAASVPGARFVHVATTANISGSSTYIDHPLTNGNSNAILLVTQNQRGFLDPVPFHDVAAADAAGIYLYQHIAVAHLGYGHLLHPDIAIVVVHPDLHRTFHYPSASFFSF